MARNNRKFGDKNEQVVVDFLVKKQICIVDRNYRCHQGEVDIIISPYSGCLAFVEVKSRSNSECGRPIEAVTKSKRAKIVRIAKYYLVEKNLYEKVDVRFDIAEVFDEGDSPRIEYYENAYIERD